MHVHGNFEFCFHAFVTYAGTHDVENLSVAKNSNSGNIEISVDYVSGSNAKGALVCVHDNGMPSLLLVTQSASSNYTLPLTLLPGPGDYPTKLFAYDIESDGTVDSGVHYPAVEKTIRITTNATTRNEGTKGTL